MTAKMNATLKTVTSRDGTTIAYDQSGEGPAIVLVDGALQYRAFDQGMAQLAGLLAQHFTVFHYDRRGRGDSTDTPPYALEREIEDIEALIDEAGGSAFIYGISSGAALALEAAIQLGSKIKKLAMYEAPYNDDDTARQAWREYRRKLNDLVAAGRGGDAVKLFVMLVGASADQAEGMRQHPMWPMWEAVGLTLAYDAAALGEDGSVPTTRAARVAAPALVMDGSESFPFMHEVDRSAPYVVGGYLFDKPRKILTKLVRSKSMPERRTAIVSTGYFTRQGDLDDTFKIAELLLDDDQDLIHKATGWMLRAAGGVDCQKLLEFLDKSVVNHAAKEEVRVHLRNKI